MKKILELRFVLILWVRLRFKKDSHPDPFAVLHHVIVVAIGEREIQHIIDGQAIVTQNTFNDFHW